MIEVRAVSKHFGSRAVLNQLSFNLAPGELVGLAGPSGSGKSVLLKVLGRVIEPDEGEIKFSGSSSGVGFSFQEGALFDSMSVIDNVAFALLSDAEFKSRKDLKDAKAEALEQAYKMLTKVGLTHAILKNPDQLSGGMRRRVALARALVAQPDLVLLDDPTGGLDPVAAAVIMNMIAELHELYHPTLLMVSHDIRRLLPRVSRLMCLFEGNLVCDLPTKDVQTEAPRKVMKFLSTRYDFSPVLS